MTQRARGRWLLALLAVLVIASCRSESEGASTTTTTTVSHPSTVPNPPTTSRTVLPATTTRTAPSTTTTAPGVVDRLGLPETVSNGELLRLRGRCPYGSDYLSMSVEFKTPEGQSIVPGGIGVGASTGADAGQKGDGSVDSFVGVNLPPGNYVAQAQCTVSEDRSNAPLPPPKVFTPFNISVTGDRLPVQLPLPISKQWTVVLRGDEAHPRAVSGAECWTHDGRILMVAPSEGGFSTGWQMPEGAVASVEPVIRGSNGCEAR